MADNETSADIIAEMETERPGLMNGPINTNNSYYARRLKAALERERGDCAKMREVMNRVHDYLGELIRDNLVEDTPRASDLADDVYDAIHGSHSTAEKSSVAGDCAKLREALKVIAAMEVPHNFQAERFDIAEACHDLTRAIRTASSALSAAWPRNCDRFTSAEEAWDAYDEWIESYRAKGKTQPLNEFGWLFAPAAEKEGGDK